MGSFPASLRIAVTGSTGLIGSALVPFLTGRGNQVRRFGRKPDGKLDLEGLTETDVVVHLAGEPVAGRWSPAKKERILRSRVEGTRLLVQALSGLKKPPGAFVCASAIGFYGDRGQEELTEDSPSGSGFLADVCRQWEAVAAGVPNSIRRVSLRFGVVLSPRGGALKPMLAVARFGLAGPLGSGNQFMSWISIEDVIGMIDHAIRDESVRGPVNVVAPSPVTHREFVRTLCGVLRRPMVPSVPAFVLRLLLGEAADALLLSSLRVLPRKAMETGYPFSHPSLEVALRALLGKRSSAV